jgi:anti-anti-sigma regulatory factor
MPVLLDESDGVFLIRLEGEVNIACAAELKSLLSKALATGRELRVRLECAAELDVTALQLLYAAERVATIAGIRFTLEGLVPDDISNAIADAGFGGLSFLAGPR